MKFLALLFTAAAAFYQNENSTEQFCQVAHSDYQQNRINTADYRHSKIVWPCPYLYSDSYVLDMSDTGDTDDYIYLGAYQAPVVKYNLREEKIETMGTGNDTLLASPYNSAPISLLISDSRLITADRDGTVRIYNKETGKLYCKFQTNDSYPSISVATGDPSKLLVTDRDESSVPKVDVFSTENCTKMDSLYHGLYLKNFKLNQDGTLLAATRGDTVHVMNQATHRVSSHKIPLSYPHIKDPLWIDNQTIAAAGVEGDDILIWKAPFNQDDIAVLTDKDMKSVNFLALHPDGKLLASVGNCGTHLWNLTDNSLFRILETRKKERFCDTRFDVGAFSHSGVLLVTVRASDASVQVWDWKANKLLHFLRLNEDDIPLTVQDIAFTASDQKIYIIYNHNVIQILGLDRAPLAEVSRYKVRCNDGTKQ